MEHSEIALLRNEMHGLRSEIKALTEQLVVVREVKTRQEHHEFRLNQHEQRLNSQSEKLDGLMQTTAEHRPQIRDSADWVKYLLTGIIAGAVSLVTSGAFHG